MSFDKAIAHGKTHRKPYRGAKAIDPDCRNHGYCTWCIENRTIRTIREKERMKSLLEEALSEARDNEEK